MHTKSQRSSGTNRVRLAIFGGFAAFLLALVIVAQRAGNASVATTVGDCSVTSAPGKQARHGAITEYTLPHPQSDLMSPAVDAQGNIWFGEMGGNRLGKLDPTNGMITEWNPPGGKSGIMGIAVDPRGDVWFAEEAASYIGRFTPSSCTFTTYPLEPRAGNAAGPSGIGLGPDGHPWFALFGNNQIGTIDPATGKVQLFPLPISDPQHPPLPYGIAYGQDGGVWFTLIGQNAIGRLDPGSGAITLFPLKTAKAQTNAIVSAPDGRLWFTEMNTGVVGVIDPQSRIIHEYPSPAEMGSTAQLYGLTLDQKGRVVVTSSGANALLRFDPASTAWTAIPLPIPASAPYGVVMAADGSLWFTEAAAGANRLGHYTEGAS